MFLTSISCSSKQNPKKFKPAYLVGNWTSAQSPDEKFTISSDGKLTLISSWQSAHAIDIQNWEAVKNKEKISYSFILDISQYGLDKFIFNFKSADECDVTDTAQMEVQHF